MAHAKTNTPDIIETAIGVLEAVLISGRSGNWHGVLGAVQELYIVAGMSSEEYDHRTSRFLTIAGNKRRKFKPCEARYDHAI